MTSIFDLLRERAAAHSAGRPAPAPAPPPPAPAPPPPGPAPGFSWSQFEPVADSPELRRVIALPRRPAFDPQGALEAELVERYTAALKRPSGTMRLRPLQAFALHELALVGGLVGMLPVGTGKTLVSFLAGTVVGAERVVLLVRASLYDKIFDLEYPELAKHWRLPNLDPTKATLRYPDVRSTLYVVTYESLSSPKATFLLDQYRPDLIVADEAHAVSLRSARTVKFRDYLKRAQPKLVALTGSAFRKSVNDGAPLCNGALGTGSPTPRDFPTQQAWGWALDPGQQRADPGALTALMAPGDQDVREGFQRRLLETPGVVATTYVPVLRRLEDGSEGATVSLNIYARRPEAPKAVAELLQQLRTKGRTPDGYEFDDVLQQSRYARQIACGFYYIRTWPELPGYENGDVGLRQAWVDAGNAYRKVVREYLAHHARPDLASPAQYAASVEAGRISCPEYAPWMAVKDRCRPGKEAVWVSDFLLEDVAEYLSAPDVTLVWVRNTALGERLSDHLGLPFFGEGPAAAQALPRESGRRSVIVAIGAHSEGRNLQTAFGNNLICQPSSNGKIWQQLLGRTHRDGQPRTDVGVTTYVHTQECEQSVFDAIENARFLEQLTKERQKLLLASFTFNPRSFRKPR